MEPRLLRVCRNCKSRKKRCDKAFPCCTPCAKLLLPCYYEPNLGTDPSRLVQSVTGDPLSNGGEEPLGDATANSGLSDLAVASSWHASLSQGYLGSVDSPSSRLSLQSAITTQILDVLAADGDSVAAVVADYSQVIDYWFPVIDPVPFNDALKSLHTQPHVELALLLLCMQLVKQMPGHKLPPSADFTVTYNAAKALLSALGSYGQASLCLVQASLLMGLYEFGSAKTHAAYRTMAVCARLGMEVIPHYSRTTIANEQPTPETRLWWGITMLDRFMNLGISPVDIYMAAGRPPADPCQLDLGSDTESSNYYTPVGADTSPTIVSHLPGSAPTPIEYFHLIAQVTHLLGQVLDCTVRWTGESKPNLQEVYHLDQSLQALALVLLQKATHEWESFCAPIALCFSALFTMHKAVCDSGSQSVPSNNYDDIQRPSVLAIKSAVRMVADIARRFNADKASINVSALPLPATFCTFQAAMLLVEFFDDEGFGGDTWRDDLHEIKTSIGVYSKRWSIGESYLLILDDAIAEKARSRLT